MAEPLQTRSLITEAWRGALAALAPNALWLVLFALLMGGWSASTADAGRIAITAVLAGLAFAAGVRLSLGVYRTLLATRSGTLLSLAHANLSVALGFGFIAFFILFFCGAFGVMMLHLSGLVDLAAEPDAATVSAAQAKLYGTPYGAALILVSVAGAAALAFVALRLLIFAPMTVDTSKAHVFRTWPLTKGRVLPLALAALATWGAPLVAGLIAVRLTGSLLPEAIAGHFGRGVLFVIFLTPFLLAGHGLAVAAYKRLKPEPEEAAAEAG